MIPKIIHYCWLSGAPYPIEIERCISSWKAKLPDYEFILWDKNRFDIDSVLWVKQAYESKKYAFAADYIRLYALYNYGGIYLDTDVEVLKSFDTLLNRDYFIGLDSQNCLEAAIIGCVPKVSWLKKCLEYYDGRMFLRETGFDMKTLPLIMEEIIKRDRSIKLINGDEVSSQMLENILYVFPFDFFCSKRHDTGDICITENTYSIHHFAMSWHSPLSKLLTHVKRLMVKILGGRITNMLINLFRLKAVKEKLV